MENWVLLGIVFVVLLLLYYNKPGYLKSVFKPDELSHVDYKKKDIKKLIPPKTNLSYAVIGTGFLGARMVDLLLERGETKIKAIDIVPCNKYENDKRVQLVKANVCVLKELEKSLEGVDVVYSTFAVIKFFHRLPHQYKFSYDVNVGGTENVIKACITCNVKYLVQTSTSYVALGHGQARMGMTEKDPYASKPFTHYNSTKAIAEKMVLEANNSKTKNGGKLLTASLRPTSQIYGWGDGYFSRPVFEEVVISLPLDHIYDYAYVDNVCYGHMLLEQQMIKTPEKVSGEAFCISDPKPITRHEFYSLWLYFNDKTQVLEIPTWFLPVLGHISETVQRIGKGRISLGIIDNWTTATRFGVEVNQSFSNEKARKLLGYSPVYTTAEAIQKTCDEYRAERAATTNKKMQ